MNKILVGLISLASIFTLTIASPFTTKVAAQGEDINENVFVEKVYTYDYDGIILTITLKNETECEISSIVDGETKTLAGTYEINEKGRLIFAVDGAGVSEEMTINSDGTLTEYVYPCVVKYEETKFGELLIDVERGEPGEIVTIYAGAFPLFKVESVIANGVILTASEDNTYKFQLVEGENIVEAKFVVSNDEIGELISIIEQYEANNWENFFSLETLGMLISWLVTLLSSGGLGIMFLKSRKVKAKTEDNVMETVLTTLEDVNTKAINEFLEKTFGPAFEKISSNLEVTDKTCKTLARCFILSQENTPEARLAIISELTSLQNTETTLAEQVKAIVESEVAKKAKAKEDKENALAELKASNDSIVVSEEKETEENSEGRY